MSAGTDKAAGTFTIRYNRVDDVDLLLDLYLPPPTPESDGRLRKPPAVVFFRGGGLAVGNRKSWFPTWLQRRLSAAGYAFISADYRLVPLATGHEIVEDIRSLFTFIQHASRDEGHFYNHLYSPQPPSSDSGLNTDPSEDELERLKTFSIDADAIVVSGGSAGGLCAYLAVMNVEFLKFRGLVSLYGMGGDFFTSQYLVPKTQPFLRGRELLDPQDFEDYLYPFPHESENEVALKPEKRSRRWISDSPLAYHSKEYRIPGYPANPRMLVTRLYLQLGVFLDYWTGEFDPSISSKLRSVPPTAQDDKKGRLREQSTGDGEYMDGDRDKRDKIMGACRGLVPEKHHVLFPQLYLTSTPSPSPTALNPPLAEVKSDFNTHWPPTLLIHGSEDSAVRPEESQNLYRLLRKRNIPAELQIIPGMEHSFDLAADAEERHASLLDGAVLFIQRCTEGVSGYMGRED
ncbi:hypothetical protein AX16_004583 [Volvariella volvacea WC 439]|nr:hypothetical protein AX16_004583 [Volvariella volvacea WC 439]